MAAEIALFDMGMLLMYLKKGVVSPEILVEYYTSRIGGINFTNTHDEKWRELSGCFLCIMSIGPTDNLLLRWKEVLESASATEDLKAKIYLTGSTIRHI